MVSNLFVMKKKVEILDWKPSPGFGFVYVRTFILSLKTGDMLTTFDGKLNKTNFFLRYELLNAGIGYFLY